jgi:O-antigen/teichoic acid export membrane protein
MAESAAWLALYPSKGGKALWMRTGRSSLAKSAIWVAAEAFGGSGFSSVGMLVIAGIIGPRPLGLTAIALGIMEAINFFPATLFHDAIVQRPCVTTQHLGSAFWSVLVLSVVLSAATMGLAAPTARFYGQPELASLLLMLSATPLCAGVTSIPTARLRRALRFRPLAIYTMLSRFLATIAGVILAADGYGPWAVIAQYSLGEAILALLLLSISGWRFTKQFSFRHARELGRFGLARTAVHFVDMSARPLFFALLGHYLPLNALGQVNLAFRLVDSITKVTTTSLSRLFLPIFSRVKGGPASLATSLARANLLNGILLVPLFVTLALTGDDLIRLLAPGKWGGMAGLVSWLAVAGVATVVQVAPATAILAAGRPLLSGFPAVAILSLVLITVLAMSPSNGVQAAMCWTLSLLFGLPIELAVLHYVMKIDLLVQLRSWTPGLLATFGTAAATLATEKILSGTSPPLRLVAALIAAGVAYLLSVAVVAAVLRRRRQLAQPVVSATADYVRRA